MAGLAAGGAGAGDVVGAGAASAKEAGGLACGGAVGVEGACIIYIGGGVGCEMASFLRINSSQSCCFICNSTMSLESTSLIRPATWVINSDIDSSVATGVEIDSLDGLPFFVSFAEASDLLEASPLLALFNWALAATECVITDRELLEKRRRSGLEEREKAALEGERS